MDDFFVYSCFQTEIKSSVLLVAITLLLILTTVTLVESRCKGLSTGKRINRCSKITSGNGKEGNQHTWKKETVAHLSCCLKVVFNHPGTLSFALKSGGRRRRWTRYSQPESDIEPFISSLVVVPNLFSATSLGMALHPVWWWHYIQSGLILNPLHPVRMWRQTRYMQSEADIKPVTSSLNKTLTVSIWRFTYFIQFKCVHLWCQYLPKLRERGTVYGHREKKAGMQWDSKLV